MSTSEFTSYISGSTSGTALGMILGFALFTSSIYIVQHIKRSSFAFIAFLGVLLYLVLNAYLLKNALDLQLKDVRADLFLLANSKGFYQRAANFLVILNISTFFIVSLSLKSISKSSSIIRYIILLCLLPSIVLSGVYSQLIGSNSGLLTSALISIGCISFVISPAPRSAKSYKISAGSRFSFLNIFRNELFVFVYICIFLVIALIICASTGLIDFSLFRISGFGSGELTSWTSRIELLTNNFSDHISYNIAFGDPYVDVYTTGQGTYLHSLISIWSSLGTIGLVMSLLLFYSLFLAYRNHYISNSFEQSPDIIKLTFILFGIIFIVCLLSTFFTWFPFWFMIGFSTACCSRK